MTSVLTKRGHLQAETRTEGKQFEDTKRKDSHLEAKEHQRLGERTGTDPSLRTSERAGPC